MSKEWLLGLLGAVVGVLLLQLFVRLRRKLTLDLRGIMLGGLSLSCLTAYFLFEGGAPGDIALAPLGHKVALILGVLFAFNAIWRALLWLASHRSSSEMQLPPFLLRLLGWVLFGVVLALSLHQIFGVKLTGVLITSTVASAVVGLSLQSLLANLFAGIALQMEGNFSVGDWVRVGGQEGKVLRRDWRSVTLLSLSEDLLSLPNTLVAKEAIVNHMYPQPALRLDVSVWVDASHPPMAVKASLQSVLDATPEIVDAPAPSIRIDEFGERGIEYKARFWTQAYGQRSHVRDIVLTRFWYALSRGGFDVALSTHTTEIQFSPEQASRRRHDHDAAAILRCLRGMTLFGFNEEQLQLLADVALLRRFAPGEFLVRQGEAGDSLMVIAQGVVGIYARNPQGVEVKVDTRTQGEFFGEMSLLTGEPRSASAMAEVETAVVLIGKEAFAEVLSADPAILSLMLDALETRRSNLASQLAASSSRQATQESGQRSRLLQNISRFLGIKLD